MKKLAVMMICASVSVGLAFGFGANDIGARVRGHTAAESEAGIYPSPEVKAQTASSAEVKETAQAGTTENTSAEKSTAAQKNTAEYKALCKAWGQLSVQAGEQNDDIDVITAAMEKISEDNKLLGFTAAGMYDLIDYTAEDFSI